jgi:hypothetical protein
MVRLKKESPLLTFLTFRKFHEEGKYGDQIMVLFLSLLE